MTASSMRRRLLGVVAGAAAVTLATATTASAHFCYVANWSDAAHQAVGSSSSSAFVELSDVAEMFVLPPSCQGYGIGDAVVADWMAAFGVPQEPLIHSRTVMAQGARGKSQGINHLSEADFAFLNEALMDAVMEAGCL